jgi:hypothetical protein
MATECCRGRRRGRAGSALTLALGLGLALAPKCPMCLAAYLSVFGLGMAAASAIAPWCLPRALALVLASAAWWARGKRHAARNPPSTAIDAPVT